MNSVQILAVAEDDADIRLDRWFKRHYPTVGHGLLEKWLRTGQVRVDGKRAKANQRLSPGLHIRVPPVPEGEAPKANPENRRPAVDEKIARMLRDAVLYMDDDVIALNKPAGIAVQGGTGTGDKHIDAWLDALMFDRDDRPRLVHRLDKDTSGVLLLGRSANAAAKLAAAFKSRAARKCYWALVVGVPKLRQGRIDAALAKLPGRAGEKMAVDEDEGKRAVTWYRVVDNALRKAAWLEMEPRTGRTHQLRAHTALMGTPIMGDGKYGGTEAFISGTGVSRKMHLHARAVRIPHPRTGKELVVVAPLPEHMEKSFEFFGFDLSSAGKPFDAFEQD
ncbi:RluA family pseudouridine synthase [Magnetospirillum gryphiswaldense]|uniref:Pseudouridine synthase n=1 Tax=Magnetospirillum gryphiswaldense TaxID=55518 RepID=A4U0J7_9PROT|nr:RluA family pseudouridine synthase [Magnetospirillum gryphiswaldense]AVM75354.1 Ribosomal large subunit pseudouridine synthase C [Magnetospirillum gryphiswaldense MSR-1]AVM79257.1 Ribosomal large subunit pseudouridine synthase C [Magnetospirillum gryphiswaldense]CAM76404.1 ribosomal large subunit pseudouridine synthase C [Magnetospirillum gryphiswaldense MSR-1]